ncbi:MAG: TRL domain-containing protein [Gammaproteobacteria bacterium]
MGRATVRSFFGAIATGDASIQTAAQNGGITEIHHVDYEAQNIFGVVADFTVVVYGN